jgi:hypothetical protein
MLAALDHQKWGRFSDAEILYREVLGVAPETFDALHMLGTVRLMLDDFDEAESLISRAIKIAGPIPDFVHNLRLCQDRRISVGLSRRSMYDTTACLLREIVCAHQGDAESLHIGELVRMHEVGSATLVYQANALNAGSWLRAVQVKNSLSLLVALRTIGVKNTGTPPVSDERAEDVEVTAKVRGKTLRFIIGAQIDFDFDLDVDVDVDTHNVVLMDRDDPEATLDLVHRLRTIGQRWQLFACDPLLSKRYCCPLLRFDTAALSFGSASTVRERTRVAVFVPDVDVASARERWRLIEALRSSGLSLDLLYPRPLPAEHMPTAGEHLVSLFDRRLPDLAERWHTLVYWAGSHAATQYRSLIDGAGVALVLAHVGTGDICERPGQNVQYFCDSDGAIAALDGWLEAKGGK